MKVLPLVLLCGLLACVSAVLNVEGTWSSRECENVLVQTEPLCLNSGNDPAVCAGYLAAPFITREYTFGDIDYTLVTNIFALPGCTSRSAVMVEKGLYSIATSPVEGTKPLDEPNSRERVSESARVVYEIDFAPEERQLTVSIPEIAGLLDAACPLAEGTFADSLNSAVNITRYNCPFLNVNSPSSCPTVQTYVRIVTDINRNDKAMTLGDITRFPNSVCSGTRPYYLSTHWLSRDRNEVANPTLIPTVATHRDDPGVSALLNRIDIDVVQDIVRKLSTPFNRFFSTNGGRHAAKFFSDSYSFVSECSTIAHNRRVDHFLDDPQMLQWSTIGRIDGRGDNAKYIFIVGGHIDSANFFDENGNSDYSLENPDLYADREAPGADDDLTGSGGVLEVYRSFVRTGFRPDRTIEFIGFAGEEMGWVDGKVSGKAGSKAIVNRYRELGFQVVGMFNLDSIGKNFVVDECNGCNNLFGITNDWTLGVFGDVSDFPNDGGAFRNSLPLRDLVISVTEQYSERPDNGEPLTVFVGPAGASDHNSFYEHGWAANAIVESDIARNLLADGFDRQIHHTSKDTADLVNFEYLEQLLRITAGVIIEASFAPDNDKPSIFVTPTDPDCFFDFNAIESTIESNYSELPGVSTSISSGFQFSASLALLLSLCMLLICL